MNLMQFFLILKARWKVAALALGLIVALTLAVSLVWPKKYSASAEVLVDVKTTDPMSGMISPMSQTYMATQMDVIKSKRVSVRVVKTLKMDQNPQAQEQWKEATDGVGSLEVWLADRLATGLDVKPARESNMVTIEYASGDPKFAAVMANAFAQAYVDTTLELRVEPARQSASWFDERTKTLRDQLEKAQTRLSDYQREHGIVANDERIDVETSRHAELSAQFTGVQAQRFESESRQRQAKGNIETSPDVMMNPVIQGLRTDLARQEVKLQELGVQLGKNHPQYQRSVEETEALRTKLAAEMRKVAASLSASNEVNEKREAGIRASLAAQKTKVLELKQQRDEISVLMRDVESTQRSYDTVTQRRNQTNLESQLNQTNVIILTPAVEPLGPSSPKIKRNMLIAVFLGTLVGIGLALGLEMTDQRVRGSDDLGGDFGFPILGVLSAVRSPSRLPGFLQRLFPKAFGYGSA